MVKIKKTEVVSKFKFEVGKFWCRFENDFDGCTTIYNLWINNLILQKLQSAIFG